MIILHEENKIKNHIDHAFKRYKEMKYGPRPEVDEDAPKHGAQAGRIGGAILGSIAGGLSGDKNTSGGTRLVRAAIGGALGYGAGHYVGKLSGYAHKAEQQRQQRLYDTDPSRYHYERKARYEDDLRRSREAEDRFYRNMHDYEMQRRDHEFKRRYNRNYR